VLDHIRHPELPSGPVAIAWGGGPRTQLESTMSPGLGEREQHATQNRSGMCILLTGPAATWGKRRKVQRVRTTPT
jgi:hypothetical protein